MPKSWPEDGERGTLLVAHQEPWPAARSPSAAPAGPALALEAGEGQTHSTGDRDGERSSWFIKGVFLLSKIRLLWKSEIFWKSVKPEYKKKITSANLLGQKERK